VRRLLLLALAVPVLAGCGAVSATQERPPATAAGPQHVDLHWIERAGNSAEGLVFGVSSLDVVDGGWRADVSLANETGTAYGIGSADLPGSLSFGLLLFATGAHSELEQRNANGSLPALRPAETFTPALPAQLPPHRTWTSTISGRGPLAAGTWVRLEFGVLFPGQQIAGGQLAPTRPTIPDSLAKAGIGGELSWITDHTYRLRR
jgi:hypothetical protein